jgi:hypothetical protein
MDTIVRNETGKALYYKNCPKILQTDEKKNLIKQIDTKFSAECLKPNGMKFSGSLEHSKINSEVYEGYGKIISKEFGFAKVGPGNYFQVSDGLGKVSYISYLAPEGLLDVSCPLGSVTIIDASYQTSNILHRYFVGTYASIGDDKFIKAKTSDYNLAEKDFNVCYSAGYTATIYDSGTKQFIKDNSAPFAPLFSLFTDKNYLDELKAFVKKEVAKSWSK